MKRDMDLVREILMAVEEQAGDPRQFLKLEIPNRDPTCVSYHVKLLQEAGLLHARNLSSSSGFLWAPTSLTWIGHEFLDAARNDTVWNKAMEKLKEHATTVPFDVLNAVVMRISRDLFGLN